MRKSDYRLIDNLVAAFLLVISTIVLYNYSVLAGIVFTAITVVYLAYVYSRSYNSSLHFFRYRTKGISSLIPNVMKQLESPVLIIGEDDKIIWANKSFENLPELSSFILLPSSGKLFDGRLTYASLQEKYESGEIDFDEVSEAGSFQVHILELTTKNNRYFAAVWTDTSENLRLKKQIDDTNVMIALTAVDNASELSQNGNEAFRLTSAKITMELTEWVKSFDGMITEFEEGQYLILFEKRFLPQLEEDKYSVIDRVTLLSNGIYTLPLTISIGISEDTGTLPEKYMSAQNALRIAFQKGGAVAVRKTVDGYNSFGGKTKSVQRQTSIRSRVCCDLLFENIRSSSNVLVMAHYRPDFDAIASNIGVAKIVSKLGKPVNIVTDVDENNISPAFDLLKGIPEYDTMFVDVRRALDLMNPNTLLIITDASNPDNFFSLDVYRNAQRVFIIDHHTYDKHYDDCVLQPTDIDPNASSASELVCEMLELAFPENILRAEEAQLLLSGILLDTQFFSRDTGSRTFRACAFLRNAGADSGVVNNLFKSDMQEFERMNQFLENRYVYHNQYMIAFYDGDKSPKNMVCAAKAAEQLVKISGIVASFVLYPLDAGISLSARSDGTFNVVNVVKMLGGGGHFQSAGARITVDGAPVQDMAKAKGILEHAIDEYIPD